MARYIALYLSSYHTFSFYLQVVVTSFFRVPLEALELLAVRSRLVLDSIYSSLMKINKSKLRSISHTIYGLILPNFPFRINTFYTYIDTFHIYYRHSILLDPWTLHHFSTSSFLDSCVTLDQKHRDTFLFLQCEPLILYCYFVRCYN